MEEVRGKTSKIVSEGSQVTKGMGAKIQECSTTCNKGCTLMTFDFFPRLLRVLVNEAFTPSICVPPSTVRMLLAYPRIVSE